MRLRLRAARTVGPLAVINPPVTRDLSRSLPGSRPSRSGHVTGPDDTIGVQDQQTYVIKRVDEDFFDEN
jgi:hypothetical protein